MMSANTDSGANDNAAAAAATAAVSSNRNSCYVETCLDVDFAGDKRSRDTVRFVKVAPNSHQQDKRDTRDRSDKADPRKQLPNKEEISRLKGTSPHHRSKVPTENLEKKDTNDTIETSKTKSENEQCSASVVKAKGDRETEEELLVERSCLESRNYVDVRDSNCEQSELTKTETVNNMKNMEKRGKSESPVKILRKGSDEGRRADSESKESTKKESDIKRRSIEAGKSLIGKDRMKAPKGRPGFLPGRNYDDERAIKKVDVYTNQNKANWSKSLSSNTSQEKHCNHQAIKSSEQEKQIGCGRLGSPPLVKIPADANKEPDKVIKEKKKNKFLNSFKMKSILKKRDKVIPVQKVEGVTSTEANPPPDTDMVDTKTSSREEFDSNEVDSGVGEEAGGVGVEEEDYDEVFDGDDEDDDMSYDGGTYRLAIKTSYDVAVGALPITGMGQSGLVVRELECLPETMVISDFTIMHPSTSTHEADDIKVSTAAASFHFPNVVSPTIEPLNIQEVIHDVSSTKANVTNSSQTGNEVLNRAHLNQISLPGCVIPIPVKIHVQQDSNLPEMKNTLNSCPLQADRKDDQIRMDQESEFELRLSDNLVICESSSLEDIGKNIQPGNNIIHTCKKDSDSRLSSSQNEHNVLSCQNVSAVNSNRLQEKKDPRVVELVNCPDSQNIKPSGKSSSSRKVTFQDSSSMTARELAARFSETNHKSKQTSQNQITAPQPLPCPIGQLDSSTRRPSKESAPNSPSEDSLPRSAETMSHSVLRTQSESCIVFIPETNFLPTENSIKNISTHQTNNSKEEGKGSPIANLQSVLNTSVSDVSKNNKEHHLDSSPPTKYLISTDSKEASAMLNNSGQIKKTKSSFWKKSPSKSPVFGKLNMPEKCSKPTLNSPRKVSDSSKENVSATIISSPQIQANGAAITNSKSQSLRTSSLTTSNLVSSPPEVTIEQTSHASRSVPDSSLPTSDPVTSEPPPFVPETAQLLPCDSSTSIACSTSQATDAKMISRDPNPPHQTFSEVQESAQLTQIHNNKSLPISTVEGDDQLAEKDPKANLLPSTAALPQREMDTPPGSAVSKGSPELPQTDPSTVQSPSATQGSSNLPPTGQDTVQSSSSTQGSSKPPQTDPNTALPSSAVPAAAESPPKSPPVPYPTPVLPSTRSPTLVLPTAPLTPVLEVRVVDAFSRAVARQNQQFVTAIQSLDALNDRIVEFVFDGWEGSTCGRGVPLEGGPSQGIGGLHSPLAEHNDRETIRHQSLHALLELMRQLLLDAQGTFRSMVEENQQLATRIDGDLQTAQDQVSALRQDLQDTKTKISQFQSSTPSPTPSCTTAPSSRTSTPHSRIPSSSPLSRSSPKPNSSSKIPVNVSKSFPGVSEGGLYKERSQSADGRRKSRSDENGDVNDSDNSTGTPSSEHLRRENERLNARNKQLASELDQLRKASTRKISSVSNASNASTASAGSRGEGSAPGGAADDGTTTTTNGGDGGEGGEGAIIAPGEGGKGEERDGSGKAAQLATELSHAKEALTALKADRKRLKTEKVDLLQQMKQLYATLEDKEAELRDFIRNFEQRMAESESVVRALRGEREAGERERWGILQRLGEEGDRAAALAQQLADRDRQVDTLRKQLSSFGYHSDGESLRTTSNGGPSTTTPPPNTTSLPPTTNTTPNGRGSSADSGVRLSSDRDSTASHEGGPSTPPKDPSCIYATPHQHPNAASSSNATNTTNSVPPNGNLRHQTNHLNHHQHQQQQQQLQQQANPYQTTSLYSTSPPPNLYSTYSSNSSSHNPYATSPPQMINSGHHMNMGHINNSFMNNSLGNNASHLTNSHLPDANPYSSSSLYSGPREDPVLLGTPRSLGGLGSLGSSQSEGGDYSVTLGHHINTNLYSSSNTPCSERSGSVGLSQSTEQLCDRVAEAAEAALNQPSSGSAPPAGFMQGGASSSAPKSRGSTMTLSRKTQKALGGGGGGTWGSISRVFARQKKRAALDATLYDGGSNNGSDNGSGGWSGGASGAIAPLSEETYPGKLRLLEAAQHIPLEKWKAPTVLAWLEVTLGMPQYGALCAENVRSGKVLLELSDNELESGLGITYTMHRKKLRLAIEELREPRLCRYPTIATLGHAWVANEWLPDLGLPHYADSFANCLVDGRVLDALTKKELEKYLGVQRKFHQASIIHGIHLLRIVRFDRHVLYERRRQVELRDADPVVWTNQRWVRWARAIDLAEYADNLRDSGVHGGLVVLEATFTADTMATALGIPGSKTIIRRHLATELESLVLPQRRQLEEAARCAKLERRRQDKLSAGGSLGRSFSRSHSGTLERQDKERRRSSLRFGSWRSTQLLS